MQEVFRNIASPMTLSQEIVQNIESGIRTKKLSAGEKLPTEQELCKMFGVSRTTLREALQILSAKGLITIRKGSGMYVNDYSSSHASENMSLYLELNFDPSYALHIMEMRHIFEPHAARMAALNRTDDHIAKLEKNLVLFGDKTLGVQGHAKYDLEFHYTIAEISGNPLMPLILDPIFKLLPKIKTMIVDRVKHNDTIDPLTHHQNILDMIKAQDEQGAFEAMTAHLKVAERDVHALLESLADEADE